MTNFKLTIQYDGTDFHGWQVQPGRRTVQGELVRVLSLLDGRDATVNGSGRTDAGVHAEGQVANVHLVTPFFPQKLRNAINGNLEPDLRVISAEEAPDDFHARFSVRAKTYTYRIINGPVLSPFWKRYALHESRSLDIEIMAKAAGFFPGEHDWSAFSAAQTDVDSRVRSVSELSVESGFDPRANCRLIQIRATANGFLRYMVRTIAGTLVSVGLGDLEPIDVSGAISTGKRLRQMATAPAHGLTLSRVYY